MQIAFGKLKEVEISGYEEISNQKLLWCHQIVTIGLEKLKIDNCDNIRSLFSSSIAQNLVTLGKLEISFCCEMVKVIEGEEEEETPQHVCLFPRLQEVNLVNLPKLGFFCKWRFSLELPSLERLWIEECPKMERFTLGAITTPNLNSVIIDFEPLDAQDLNHVLLRVTISVTILSLLFLGDQIRLIKSTFGSVLYDLEINKKNIPVLHHVVTESYVFAVFYSFIYDFVYKV